MVSEIEGCRICWSKDLTTVLDLGSIYPSAFLRADEKVSESSKAPLVLVKCNDCGLVQLKHTVELDLMYRQYWYSSALNSSMVSSLKDITDMIEGSGWLHEGDITLDIGSNDGTLLDLYRTKNIVKVGFDPAYNIKPKGNFIFVNNYFSAKRYEEIWVTDVKKANVITAIAMFYDLADPVEFVRDIKRILAPDGHFIIQLTDLYSMFKVNAFDNICHEHLEYYSLAVINDLFNENGLEIVDVSYNNVNGGSVRVVATHKSDNPQNKSVLDAIENERTFFENPKNSFRHFKHMIDETVFRVKDFLFDTKFRNETVYVMGASTKGNTLLQLCGITNEDIKYAVEVNPEKFGLRTVGSNITIISEDESPAPNYFLVLPWHFIDTLIGKHSIYLNNGGTFVVPLPYFHLIGAGETVEKTLGFLIDELFTTDHKCWNAQEDIMNESLSTEDRLDAAIRAQKFNSRRNELIRAIDKVAGQAHLSPTTKSYYSYFERNSGHNPSGKS